MMHISYDITCNRNQVNKSFEPIIFRDNCITIYDSEYISKKEIYQSENSISITFGVIYNGKDVITNNQYSWSSTLSESIISPVSENNFSLFSQLNGSFCCVVYSKQDKTLYIISDRYGSHRYFYGTQEGKTIISSSIWTFKQHGFKLDIDKNFLLQFLSFGYIPTKQTQFKNVKLNHYATVFKVNNSDHSINQYWHLKFNEAEPITEIDYMAQQASTKWPNAIETSLSDTGKTAILLSGGLDSRAILAAALECKQSEDIITFTGGTPGTFDYEIGKLIAKHVGVKNITMDMTASKEYLLDYRQMMHDMNGLVDIIPFFFSSDWRNIKNYSPFVVSGSCASFITGTHLSSSVMETYSQNKTSNNGFLENALHINLAVNHDHVSKLIGISPQENHRILTDLILLADHGNENRWLPNRCDHWDFSNRLRNYIMSLLAPKSVFHFINPMLENEWVDLCTSASPELRYKSSWYKKFLINQYPKLFSLPTKNFNGRPLKQNIYQKIETFSENSTMSLLSLLPSNLNKKASIRVSELFQSKYLKPYTPDEKFCRPERVRTNYMDYNYWLRGANKQWTEVVHSLIRKTIEFGLVPEQPVQNLISKQLKGDDQSGIVLLYLSSLGLLLDIHQSI